MRWQVFTPRTLCLLHIPIGVSGRQPTGGCRAVLDLWGSAMELRFHRAFGSQVSDQVVQPASAPPRSAKVTTTLGGAALAALTVGYILQLSWATSTWPWPDGRLSYLFVGSMLAAVTASVLWIGITGEFGAAVGGALNFSVAFVAMGVYLLRLRTSGGESHLGPYALGFLVFAAFALGYAVWAHRFPIRDARPMPGAVRASLWVFAGALLLVSTALILQSPHVFPWPLKPESSTMYGALFLGSAMLFGYTATRHTWYEAKAALLPFLAYDLVLIVPFVRLLGEQKPGHLLSLVLYLVVLGYSGALAVYYLFVNRATRSWRIER
jgi:hypothetical protein